MQLGKTLVGALIGAALGIGLLIAVYLLFGIDKMWMAIPVALLTGLGVRMVAATSGNASYLRGAITVVLAMAAYLGGLAVTRAVASHRTDSVSKAHPPRVAKEEASEPGDTKSEEPTAEATPVKAAPIAPMNHDTTMRSAVPIQPISTWDFISLAVAALVAYELGRGSGMASNDNMVAGPGEPVLGGTHPDA
jgi:hypothetical protein